MIVEGVSNIGDLLYDLRLYNNKSLRFTITDWSQTTSEVHMWYNNMDLGPILKSSWG